MAGEQSAVYVITGGAGGMGIACARRLGRRGRVLLSDVAERRLAEVAAELSASGIQVETRVADVADPAAVRALAEAAAGLGPLAALVHTAGLSPTMASWRRVMEVDLVGTALLIEAFRPLARPGSVAVCISSIAGHLQPPAPPELMEALDAPLAEGFLERIAPHFEGRPDAPSLAYGWAKQAVIRLVEREAAAWGRQGARIVSLSPGIIRTPMAEQEFKVQPQMAQMVRLTPLARIGEPDEIASAVEFLVGEGASYITGCDLRVDGGTTAAMRHLS
ncbi:SDR family oxidoreductase [Geochorda subterranea]|uniref:SDR family oxidoreductase n=1 Tax=Geochorda subterranea TaxID=3109564 RepID=A0ABZ1BP29_9FIRM|nr:SDR family oxidoreductase [Limnochorda sp. LNt]WRP14348.1 SDR family oxidoreductase [Limnochorda sp. LNt]